MLSTKADVSLAGMRPELLIAVIAMHAIYQRRDKTLMLTSVADGRHSTGSLHYKGLAFDCRISNLAAGDADRVATELRVALHPLFDVVVEADHIHVEYDPHYVEPLAKVA